MPDTVVVTKVSDLCGEGTLITVGFAGNAKGNSHSLSFPVKMFQDHFMRDGPAGSAGSVNGLGGYRRKTSWTLSTTLQSTPYEP